MAVRLSVAFALLCGLAAGVAASSAEDRAIVLATAASRTARQLAGSFRSIFARRADRANELAGPAANAAITNGSERASTTA